jgi:mRNA-degrading endonuclease YafQ of YafQ-DinJ toxin-antitoxin module
MRRLVFTKTYERAEKKFLSKHPDLIERYKKILELLELEPTHPSLKLHGLGGKLEGVYAVHITHSYRIALSFMRHEVNKKDSNKNKSPDKNKAKPEDEIVLLYIGSHDEVYR